MTDDATIRILAALERLEAGQAKLEASQAKLRAEVMERLDRLQDSIGAIRDDITVNYGHTEQAQRLTNLVREEARAQFTVLQGAVDGVRSQVNGLGQIMNAMERQVRGLSATVHMVRDEVATRMVLRDP